MRRGGGEYLEVNGMSPLEDEAFRTYIDYDPVTGKSLRTSIRQQVMMRVERGSMFPNIISSQDRCVVPTKSFHGNSGYGCFAFYPIMWFEDTRLINPEDFFQNVAHYYTRPGMYDVATFPSPHDP